MLKTYTNPVYPHYFADPFVLKHEGMYYAYGTGPAGADGSQFPLLTSRDLVHWEQHGWALSPMAALHFWAPEVAFADGIFYLYYSAQGIDGHDHRLRVATSASPLGPFQDAGKVLVPDQPFSIDAHPFQDADGQWYLFYARDFLMADGPMRVGTGIAVDKLVRMDELAHEPRVVVRPYADWHLFQAARSIYENVYDWHTVEGPAVRRHRGRYYCFFSGGAWERENYGIGYVVADHPLGPYAPPSDDNGPILRSVQGHVTGPGHNSFVESPDGTERYCVYHAWDSAMTARTLRIDLLTWHDGQPHIHGPTWTPQPIVKATARPVPST
jgi:GH43 family beta-xylosidase